MIVSAARRSDEVLQGQFINNKQSSEVLVVVVPLDNAVFGMNLSAPASERALARLKKLEQAWVPR